MFPQVPHARVYEPEPQGLLSDENRKYLRTVLRMKDGEPFILTDGQGTERLAVLGPRGEYSAQQPYEPQREPNIAVTLFPALSKGDRLENLLEKAIELGAVSVVPLKANRCVVGAPSASKLERFEKIAVAAMLQCGGCRKPIIGAPVKTDEIPIPPAEVLPLLLHEASLEESIPLPLHPDKPNVWIASGPEGGFDPAEVRLFLERGWKIVWLGNRLFKTDTAPLAALSAIILGGQHL